MNRRILVPVSHDPGSEQGIVEGLRLARSNGATLRFIHVFHTAPEQPVPEGFSGAIDRYLELLEAAERGCIDIVKAIHELADGSGVAFDVVLRSIQDATVCDTVAEEAKAWRADFIVVGARKTDLGVGPPVGSVAARLLDMSPVPVMAVSPQPVRP